MLLLILNFIYSLEIKILIGKTWSDLHYNMWTSSICSICFFFLSFDVASLLMLMLTLINKIFTSII